MTSAETLLGGGPDREDAEALLDAALREVVDQAGQTPGAVPATWEIAVDARHDVARIDYEPPTTGESRVNAEVLGAVVGAFLAANRQVPTVIPSRLDATVTAPDVDGGIDWTIDPAWTVGFVNGWLSDAEVLGLIFQHSPELTRSSDAPDETAHAGEQSTD